MEDIIRYFIELLVKVVIFQLHMIFYIVCIGLVIITYKKIKRF